MYLLEKHFNTIEKDLLEKSKIAKNSGHPLLKGNAREAFISDFLKDHIGCSVRIGTGEIIDSSTNVSDKRNQMDIVLYNASFPKINYATNVDAFLVESVNTTIEVKSKITKKGLEKAIQAANNIKKLNRNVKRFINPQKSVTPRLYCYLVAYDGPAKMDTVHKWLIEIEKKLGINQDNLPVERTQRFTVGSEALDGIFILGKGVVVFDNLPLTFEISDSLYKEEPENKRVIINQDQRNILVFFLYLVEQIKGIETDVVDMESYYSKIVKGDKDVLWTT